ncbi:disulfide bond formation regulator [Nonlabens dokdonensis]|uniref:Disulfide bond formation regulator n=1 Tax=Nonlabens dokdonensis TaxID=328515 RepID=A0A1Z8AM43_9FLAO|nr:OsmC family protein [Nonlabens dokdonensis]OUS11412.1 disulfide bond formation regulator [Nonlabens dokdonensis]
MKITLERKNTGYLLEAKGVSGNTVMIDHSGMETVQGVSPMELLLMGVGSCSAIDIIAILKKQRQDITSYKVEVTGERYELDDSKPFKSMHVTVLLEGDINPDKAQKAADLSFEKYCSVSKSFDKCVEITWEIVL